MRKGRFAGFSVSAPRAMPRLPVGRRAALFLILGAPLLVLAAGLADARPPALLGGAALALLAALGGLWRLAVARPSAAPADDVRADRFVAEFEQGGCGWFWETNADGLITYLSEPLAKALGREAGALAGRPFVELLLVEDHDETDNQRPTLGFHLARRFPFADIIVSPNGRKALCWSLSGRPRFDEVGRFLGFRGVGLQLSAERQTERRSSRLAACDSLTGLANRGRMRAMLDEALANADSRKEGCGLFMIDLDRFKQVNDTFGHPIGDLLLREVAQRLAAVVGGEGQVGRLGGDEFEALLPGIDEEGLLAALAERIITKVSAPYVVRGHSIAIGVSIGIAISRPGRTLADALIKEADLALYAAKGAGRGTYCFFEPEMHAQESERRILDNDLRLALAKGELRLAFQPVVSATSEQLVGFEALVRWMHPVRGLLAPAEFLPLAEATGLIAGIGDWVVRAACAEAAKWPAHLRLWVNLTRAELEQPRLTAGIAQALAAAALEPDRLELDLPEAALLADSAELRAALRSLKALGVRLALDDFGQGSASILSLRSAPLDAVKIDGALLRAAVPDGGRARAVVAAITGLAETLGMHVVAEGVETPVELAVAREVGCCHIQGFLFGRPMSSGEAMELAATSRPIAAGEGMRPRPPRHSLIRRGALRWRGGSLAVRLRNISADGAMLEAGQAIEAGAEVELDLSEGVRLAGQVRWSQHGRIGLSFAEAFDLRRLGSAPRAAAGELVKPDYLRSELQPDSPWAGRHDRLTIKDVRRR